MLSRGRCIDSNALRQFDFYGRNTVVRLRVDATAMRIDDGFDDGGWGAMEPKTNVSPESAVWGATEQKVHLSFVSSSAR